MDFTAPIDEMITKLNIEMDDDKIPASERSAMYSPIKKVGMTVTPPVFISVTIVIQSVLLTRIQRNFAKALE
ncbi:hypothetical protein DPMN_022696 [Dreissena polymorpha]|uniref:Uncharacterized protein n=1 Tax=Dreissena polymorpha TaxID=45954 RepID=A0A9D4NQP0_DREPO|nr:hypothetical protein DPMN_022696 [Dreissena polymorpha]